MKEFSLEIVTPEGLVFSGNAESILARCEGGDVEIMRGHADFFSPLGIGIAKIKSEGKTRIASAAGGFLSVSNGAIRLVCTTFEFAENIDKERAELAKANAEKLIANAKDKKALTIAEAKLRRALNRLNAIDLM